MKFVSSTAIICNDHVLFDLYRVLFSELSDMKALRVLCLSRCGLEDSGMHDFAQQLKELSTLRSLDMSRNVINEGGAEQIVLAGTPSMFTPCYACVCFVSVASSVTPVLKRLTFLVP